MKWLNTPCHCTHSISIGPCPHEMAQAIERVRALHYKVEYVIPGCSEPQCCGDGESGFECHECGEYYPCTTISTLDGEQE